MSWPFEQRTSARNDLVASVLSSFFALDYMLAAHVGHFRILVPANQHAILVSRDINSNVGGNDFFSKTWSIIKACKRNDFANTHLLKNSY